MHATGNLAGMENIDMTLHFPDEDDRCTRTERHVPPGAGWVSWLALACMLVAGASVLA